MFNKDKSKHPWWTYKTNLPKLQLPHSQKDFLKNDTTKLLMRENTQNEFLEREWEVRNEITFLDVKNVGKHP